MRILVFGGFGNASMENAFIRAWAANPLVRSLEKIDRFKYLNSKFGSRLLKRIWIGFGPDIWRMNRALIKKVKAQNPDVLVVFKGMELHPRTLGAIKSLGVRLICYNPDNPYIFSGRGSGNKWVYDSKGVYDLYLTYSSTTSRRLEQDGIATEILPFGYEPEAIECPLVREEDEIKRVCFIGNPDKERADFITRFGAHVPIDVYGHEWENYLDPSAEVRCFDAVYGKDHWKTMSQYRVQLNLMRPHNLDSHNMRTFSAPAAGAILLAPATPDHNRFFRDGEEVGLFSDLESATHSAKKLLKLTYAQGLVMRNSARARCLHEGYSYSSRAQALLNHIAQITAKNL